jgi:hypothetical protein
MSKKKKIDEEIGFICTQCAEERGCKWPPHHVATMHTGICPFCGKEKSLANEGDWNWTDGKLRGMRD